MSAVVDLFGIALVALVFLANLAEMHRRDALTPSQREADDLDDRYEAAIW